MVAVNECHGSPDEEKKKKKELVGAAARIRLRGDFLFLLISKPITVKSSLVRSRLLWPIL